MDSLTSPAIGRAGRRLSGGVVVSAVVELDSKYWKKQDADHQGSLACHELGHVLMGPGHSTHKKSCMQSKNYEDKTPDSDDFAKVRSLYRVR